MSHEGALRASLQEVYGLRLIAGGRTEPERSLAELADLVAWMPRGCALFRAMGGAAALTFDGELLRMIDVGIRALAWQKSKDGQAGRNRPEPIDYPGPANAPTRDDGSKWAAKGAAWLARHQGNGSDG